MSKFNSIEDFLSVTSNNCCILIPKCWETKTLEVTFNGEETSIVITAHCKPPPEDGG